MQSPRRLHLVFSLFLLLVALALPLPAQEQSAQESKDVNEISLDDLLNTEVVTAGRAAQKLSKAPATMIVLTEKQIRERGYKDLKDIFRDLPGFDISENNQGEVRTLVTSRGIRGNNKLMILRDGKKINSPGGELFVYGNNVPLFDIKRIEIIYGPSSAMYGADAFSGVVNLITKDTADFKEGNGGEADVSYGTQNTLDVEGLVAARLNQDISFVASGRIYRSDGENVLDRFSADEILRNATYFNGIWEQPIKDYNVSAKAHLGDFTVGFWRQDAKEPGGPGTDCTQNGFSYLYNENYVWHQKMNLLYVEHLLSRDRYAITSTVTYTDYALGRESNFNYSWGPQYKYAKTTSWKWEELVNYTFHERVRATMGTMLEKVSCFPKTNNLATPFEGNQLTDYVDYPDSPSLPDEYRGQRVYFGVFDYYNFAAYGEVTADLAKTVQVNVGVRYDYNSDYKNVVNPRAGLIWSPDEKTNLKFLYGKAYIAPSKYVAYEHWSAGAFGYYPNPDLKPERLESFSANLQRRLTDRIAVTGNIYYNKMKDLIVTAGYPWMHNVNAGKATTKGFELMFDYESEALSAFAYYTYLNAKMEDGSPIPKAADHKINAGLTYRLKGFTFAPRVRYSSEISKIPNPGFDESDTIDGHTVVDLSVRRENIKEHLDLYINFVNLFNAKYYASAPYGEGPDGWVMDKVPQPGFSLTAGVKLHF